MGTRYGAGNHAFIGRRGKLCQDISKVNLYSDIHSCWLLVDLFASSLSIFHQNEGWQEVMIAQSDTSSSTFVQ